MAYRHIVKQRYSRYIEEWVACDADSAGHADAVFV